MGSPVLLEVSWDQSIAAFEVEAVAADVCVHAVVNVSFSTFEEERGVVHGSWAWS